MKLGLLSVAMVTLVLCSLASPASAQMYDGRVIFNRNYAPQRVHWKQANWSPEFRGFPSYEAYRYYMNERYPKFYGGFHSNYFHNMGIPSGDIGIRGNGIYPIPWSH